MARWGLSGSRGRGKEEEEREAGARARRWRRMMRRGGEKEVRRIRDSLGGSLVCVSSHPCRYNSAANVVELFQKKSFSSKRKRINRAQQRHLTRNFSSGDPWVKRKGGRALVFNVSLRLDERFLETT